MITKLFYFLCGCIFLSGCKNQHSGSDGIVSYDYLYETRNNAANAVLDSATVCGERYSVTASEGLIDSSMYYKGKRDAYIQSCTLIWPQ